MADVSKMDKYRKVAKVFAGKEKSVDEIRDHLKKFLGGSVDLSKRDNGVAVVTLNHESKKNAVSGKMMSDLLDVVQELESWHEGKGVVIRGSGENFCSGGDLDFVRQIATPDEGFMMSTFMQSLLHRFQCLPLVSVAAIEGIGALGGGAELSMACDFRLVSEKCRGIGFVHAKMGIIPAWGGATRLVRKIGYANALDLLATARIATPSECLSLGLADAIIPEGEDNCTEYAVRWTTNKARFRSDVMRAIKAVCSNALEDRDDASAFEVERRIFAPFWGSPGNIEALSKNIKHNASVEDEAKK